MILHSSGGTIVDRKLTAHARSLCSLRLFAGVRQILCSVSVRACGGMVSNFGVFAEAISNCMSRTGLLHQMGLPVVRRRA